MTSRHFVPTTLSRRPLDLVFLLAAGLVLGVGVASGASNTNLLWELGKPDQADAEFAFAPDHYKDFRDDSFFVVNQSDPKRDWAYVQPGPGDSWAGSRPHTFSIAFGLKSAPTKGECKLLVHLVDTHRQSPPELKIAINGHESKQKMPPGGGDESVYGQPAKGKPYAFEVAVPAAALKVGLNEIGITTVSGSWVLYDWVGFEAPAGTELTTVSGTVISSASSPPVLVERGGKLMQVIHLAVRHFGEGARSVLRVDGGVVTNLVLQAAAQSLEVVVPAVEKPKRCALTIEAGSQTVARQEVDLKPVRKWVVYLLPHSHVDIGYTHVQTDVEKAQWRYLEMAIEAARKSAGYPAGSRFKWNTEVLWAVDGYLKQATPEKQQEFFAAVKAGWVGLDALYGNELTGLCRPEELLRLVRLATQLSDRSGVPIQSAMITDVPGYTWGVVPTFAHSGVRYFSIGPNGGDRIGHTIAAWGDKPFWWIGPNGRDKVLVWMTGTGYYRVFQSPAGLQNYLAGLEARGYPYDMVQVRHCLGDNGAPDVDFADTVKQWNQTHAYPKLVIATTAEMFRDFERRYGNKLPQAKGDFTPYWEDGAASSARETAFNRASADRLTQAETLFALRRLKDYPAAEFEAAWRNVLLYDEHTWGAHNSISEPDAPFVRSQWAIKQANALDANIQSRKLLVDALGWTGPIAGPAEALDVLNTSATPRTDLVSVPIDLRLPGDVVVEANGDPVSSQRLSSGQLVFLAKAVPALGAKRFLFKSGTNSAPGKAKAENTNLSTSDLALRVDAKTGGVISLRTDFVLNEWVDFRAPTALNDYFYLPGSDLKALQRNPEVKVSVKESGPLVASLLVESDAPGCARLTREIRVIDGLDRVDFINVVDKKAVRSKEGVHFGFAFNIPDGRLRLDVPWAVVRPEQDQIPGACKNWFTVQRWVDISNERFGITWATPDAPLVEIGGITANLIGSLPNPKVWLDHIEPSQRLYSWAMNNHWHTNYRAEQEGPTVFRYSLWVHQAVDDAAIAQFGSDCSQPLLLAPAKGEVPSRPLLQVKGAGVQLSAFKPSEDGKAYIVRLFGASGKTEHARLVWSAPAPKQLWLSDNSEKPKKKIGASVRVPAYGIVTVRAELP